MFALIGVAAVLATSAGCDAARDHRATAARSPAESDGRAPLGLKLERVGDDVRISWDRNASAVAQAQRAVLTILEGNLPREFSIDAVMLRTGSIVYSPLTDDVAFRLEVVGEFGAQVESVRFIRASAAPLIDAALPPASLQSAFPAAGRAEPSGARAAGRPVQEDSDATAARPIVRTDEPEEETAAVERIRIALNDQRFRWRSLAALAAAGGMTEEAALALLRTQPDVVIKLSRAKRWIARRADR